MPDRLEVEEDGLLGVELTDIGSGWIRLEICSVPHPFDPQGYWVSDAVLRRVDELMSIEEINGSERDRWRPFRYSWLSAESEEE